MGYKVSVAGKIGEEDFKTTIKTKDNVIISDTPVKYGGQNKGFNPFEILVASLASCTLITMRLYAERKKWNIAVIKVNVELERDIAHNKTTFNLYIDFEDSELTNQERQRMLEIAEKCPVHKVLKNDVKMFSELKTDVI